MPEKMRPKEVAEYTGLPITVIMRAAKSDPPRLVGYAAGPFGPWFFDKFEVDAWMESMRNKPSARATEVAAHARQAKRAQAEAVSV